MYYKQIPNSGETRSVISWERGEVNRNQNGSFVFSKRSRDREIETLFFIVDVFDTVRRFIVPKVYTIN